jgi:hypothetical protein
MAAGESTIKQIANNTYEGPAHTLKTIKRTAIFGMFHAISHDQRIATGRIDSPQTRPCTTETVRTVHPILPARRHRSCEDPVVMVTLPREVMYTTTPVV